MRYFIASDHAGFRLKNRLKADFKKEVDFKDLGIHSDERADYPKIAIKLAKIVAQEKEALGILICGTGIGMSIAANKVPGARAAVIHDSTTAKMARQHNNANIACIGARETTEKTAFALAKTFLEENFLGHEKEGERHLKRVNQIHEIEKEQFK